MNELGYVTIDKNAEFASTSLSADDDELCAIYVSELEKSIITIPIEFLLMLFEEDEIYEYTKERDESDE